MMNRPLGVGSILLLMVCMVVASRGCAADTPPAILVVTAHPDDIETICGGYVLQQVQQGARVGYVIATSGDKGYGKDVTTAPGAIASMREQEAINAADVLGVSYVHFLRYPDGGLEGVDPIELKRRIAIEIRLFKPDVVLTFNPDITTADYAKSWYYGLVHRDHLTVGRATMDAVYPASRDWRALPDLLAIGLQPYAAHTLMLFAFANAPHVIDVTAQMDTKIKAMLQHKTQYTDPNDVAMWLYQIAETVANTSAPLTPAAQYAEGYIIVPQLP